MAKSAATKFGIAVLNFLFFYYTKAENPPNSTDATATQISENPTVEGRTERPALRSFSITCCKDGVPTVDKELDPFLISFEYEAAGNVTYDQTCVRYTGQYSVDWKYFSDENRRSQGVRCKCPEEGMDRNCRKLAPCQNSGYRSYSIQLRCVCVGGYFGELCEKLCENGLLVKDENGIDQCQCDDLYDGDRCERVICLNGGAPSERFRSGCLCNLPYVGLHCEHQLNGAGGAGGAEFHIEQRQDALHRDLIGTVVSLFLIVALAAAVYFLAKRRTVAVRRQLFELRTRQQELQQQTIATGSQTGSNGFVNQPPPYSQYMSYAIGGRPDLAPPPSYHEIVKDDNGRPLPAEAAAPASQTEPAPGVNQTFESNEIGPTSTLRSDPTANQNPRLDPPFSSNLRFDPTANTNPRSDPHGSNNFPSSSVDVSVDGRHTAAGPNASGDVASGSQGVQNSTMQI